MNESASRAAPARIREARQRLFPSAMAFAERLGVSHNTYISHERGERGMDLDIIERCSAVLSVSLGWLALAEIPGGIGPGLQAVGQAALD